MAKNNKSKKDLTLYKGKHICDKWLLMSRLGEGGNGIVWKCKDKTGCVAAIKFLVNPYSKLYQRFKDEVAIQESYSSTINGILPILDKNLPNVNKSYDINKSPIYYVMPLCESLTKSLKTISFDEKVSIIVDLLNELENLHKLGIAHRDIKVENILKYNGNYVFSDFGLVYYPGKRRITRTNEKIGAKRSIAPEMERPGADAADMYKADIYSLAKVIWTIFTSDINSFEGQYVRNSSISINRFIDKKLAENIYWSPLEILLQKCTDHSPILRPSITQFKDLFINWLGIQQDFSRRSLAEWDEVIFDLFSYTVPNYVEWTDNNEIIKVLNLASKYDNLNHLFFPNGGGLDLSYVKNYYDNEWIELNFDGLVFVLKPKKLTFNSFNAENQWNYFRIEVDHSEPIGSSYDEFEEALTELSPLNYAPYEVYEYPDSYPQYSVSKESRQIIRCLNGDLIIFNKASIYNQTSDTYDGRHAKMSPSRFKEYIEQSVDFGGLLKNWKQFIK